MEALVHDTLEDFLAVAGDFLNADPVNHSVHLTTVDSALRGLRPPAALLSLHANGTLVGAATRMEGRPLHVAAMPPAAAAAVAEALCGQPIDAVTGPVECVEAFRALWRDGGRETYRLRLYRLGELVMPRVPGKARVAGAADEDLVTEWWVRFVAELDGLERDEAEEVMRGSRNMPAGHVLWEVDGVVVAWAGSTSPVAGVSRVGPVYTPPDHRRRGYGAAVTAAVSRWAHEAGAEHVVLTADLANPTANSVYQGIGFRAVSDWSEYKW
ncbi:GNAT family N-acetyltransferase [Lentzea nigeriaca]|uniref:GNAT family N-acetyltransferase n=1 Tax=Lentzea nigeriaca TaxID=1128665 RepID=UPI00195DD409|nr:GNAT family N-acetyltransferase [Lentzea nigeriaca]MBM7861120.1 GNAT superfamily N-acetyltransferase [Lentzea nigeriaca]